jgi:hypothetical protein
MATNRRNYDYKSADKIKAEIEDLMKKKEYQDSRDPKHKEIVAKVKKLYEQYYALQGRAEEG